MATIRPREAARLLNKSEQWVTEQCRDNKLPCTKIGGEWFLEEEEIVLWKEWQGRPSQGIRKEMSDWKETQDGND